MGTDAGFIDAWRAIHPDPAKALGATWPSAASSGKCTSWATTADERDRIDFIYYNNFAKLRATDAMLVGPPEYYVFGKIEKSDQQGPFLESTQSLPWPSDHKGVIADFE